MYKITSYRDLITKKIVFIKALDNKAIITGYYTVDTDNQIVLREAPVYGESVPHEYSFEFILSNPNIEIWTGATYD